MAALDFTAFPSKPAAPPAASAGAPRPTARASAPAGAPKTGSKNGSANAANGEFGSLVDRLADAPDEGQASSRGVMARGSRDAGVIGEESAAEPRAKGDADEASGAANDASAANTSMASNPAPFPWTLPLSPSLWAIEPVKTPEENGGDTHHRDGEGDGDGVMSAITAAVSGAIADGAGACVATLPGAETHAEGAGPSFTAPVDAPIAIDPAATSGAASTASAQGTGTQGAIGASDAGDSAWSDAAAGNAGGVDAAAAAAGAAGDKATGGEGLLASSSLASAALANASVTNGRFGSESATNESGSESPGGESTIDRAAIAALANARTNSPSGANSAMQSASSITSNDSTMLAPSATDSATTAAAVDHAVATTAAGHSAPTNAAPEAPAPGDQAREQALLELQRVFDAARASASSETGKARVRNSDAPIVLHTGSLANAGANDATASANGAAHQSALEAVANAGNGSNGAGTLTGDAGVDAALASASASGQGRTSRLRDGQETSEDLDVDGELTGASSWAAAAAAKYADAAGTGTSGGTLDGGGSNADAANSALAGRAGDAGGHASSIAFDARVIGASRANEHAGIADGSAGESAIVTTASPEEQAAQIVKSMRLQWRGANGEAALRLTPDHLGQVFVSVRVEQGTVTATLRAETAAAQQWIQQHQQQLRDALDAQGLRVAQFHVTHNPDDRPRRDQEHDQQDKDPSGRRSSRARARRSDDDRRFEIHL